MYLLNFINITNKAMINFFSIYWNGLKYDIFNVVVF
jgi:hypothetical protein